jgi:hypothetical protein
MLACGVLPIGYAAADLSLVFESCERVYVDRPALCSIARIEGEYAPNWVAEVEHRIGKDRRGFVSGSTDRDDFRKDKAGQKRSTAAVTANAIASESLFTPASSPLRALLSPQPGGVSELNGR